MLGEVVGRDTLVRVTVCSHPDVVKLLIFTKQEEARLVLHKSAGASVSLHYD